MGAGGAGLLEVREGIVMKVLRVDLKDVVGFEVGPGGGIGGWRGGW